MLFHMQSMNIKSGRAKSWSSILQRYACRGRHIPSKSTFRHAVSEVPAVCESSDRCLLDSVGVSVLQEATVAGNTMSQL